MSRSFNKNEADRMNMSEVEGSLQQLNRMLGSREKLNTRQSNYQMRTKCEFPSHENQKLYLIFSYKSSKLVVYFYL